MQDRLSQVDIYFTFKQGLTQDLQTTDSVRNQQAMISKLNNHRHL